MIWPSKVTIEAVPQSEVIVYTQTFSDVSWLYIQSWEKEGQLSHALLYIYYSSIVLCKGHMPYTPIGVLCKGRSHTQTKGRQTQQGWPQVFCWLWRHQVHHSIIQSLHCFAVFTALLWHIFFGLSSQKDHTITTSCTPTIAKRQKLFGGTQRNHQCITKYSHIQNKEGKSTHCVLYIVHYNNLWNPSRLYIILPPSSL